MALAEAQARLNVSLRDIVTFFEEGGIHQRSILLLNEYIDKHLTNDFLELAESFGECMAFLDHDLLMSKLNSAWCLLFDGFTIERKMIMKKIKALKEDKKADPAVVQKQENLLQELDDKKAMTLIQMNRIRSMQTIPIEHFKANPNFDYKAYHRELELQKKAAATAK